jgi:NADH-quinone oxidoreductase subunit L
MPFLILIPLVPLATCLLLAVAGRRLGEASHKVGVTAVAASFALSVAAGIVVLQQGAQSVGEYRFLEAGALTVDVGLYVDQLTVLLLLLVTGVSAIVHVYSSRYLMGDPRYPRFFAVMALFTTAMIMLVMSRNLLTTYMSWEVMGICSYLLISHWAHRPAAAAAATKAFLVNAIADVGLGCGVLLTFQTFGTLDIPTILAQAPTASTVTVNLLSWAGLEWPVPAVTVIALLVFTGAMGKSAQLPFHVWLPFAMEAPTPVSALIHAATMVNAGPFLLVRLSPLLVLAPAAMAVMAVVGAATALFAAVVSATQSDIKKILAYSTISQIGFMIMMCGVGAFAAAVFHLLAHGFLKAFLFLSTGDALRALTPHHMHGPATHAGSAPRSWVLAAGTLLFACLPPAMLFSGPYEAMWTRQEFPQATVVFRIVALATVFLTAAYLARAAEARFQRGFALARSVVRPRFFSVPHVLVAGAWALVLMAFLIAFPSWFVGFIAPALAPAVGSIPIPGPPVSLVWLVLPLLAAVGGWAFAVLGTRVHYPLAVRRRAWVKRLYVLFWNKLYFDEIYDAYFVLPNLRAARALNGKVEHAIVDRALNLLGSTSVAAAFWLWRVLEGRGVDRAVSGTVTASMSTARWLWKVLEGRAIQGSTDQLSHQVESVGRYLQHKELHTLQEHLLLVVSGLAALLGLFYLVLHGMN